MKSIRELMSESKDYKQLAEITKQKMLERGFVYSEAYGWEKPEILERFGLDPNMTAIPGQIYDDLDYKEVTTEEKDAYGRKTGNKFVEKVPFKTGKKVWCESERWLAYQIYKDKKSEQEYFDFKNSERIAENY